MSGRTVFDGKSFEESDGEGTVETVPQTLSEPYAA
jgi:hypothetical protein